MSPWIINKKQGGHHVIRRDKGHLPMVADVYGTDAEARLIASAPDLLDALWGIYYHVYDPETSREDLEGDFDRMRDIAYAAITKANGGE